MTGKPNFCTEKMAQVPTVLKSIYERICKASYILVPVPKPVPVPKAVFVEEPNISKARLVVSSPDR